MNIDDATIIGFVTAATFLDYSARVHGLVNYGYWDEKHPGWREGNIVILEYDTPQKNLAFSEFWEQSKGTMSFETAEAEYDKLPTYKTIGVPEQSLNLKVENE